MSIILVSWELFFLLVIDNGEINLFDYYQLQLIVFKLENLPTLLQCFAALVDVWKL